MKGKKILNIFGNLKMLDKKNLGILEDHNLLKSFVSICCNANTVVNRGNLSQDLGKFCALLGFS